MKIENDSVIFETADFDGFSDFAKKAATAYLEDYPAAFSRLVNEYLRLSKAHLKTLAVSDPVTSSILSGLASADEAKLAEAAPLLASLDALLNPKP